MANVKLGLAGLNDAQFSALLQTHKEDMDGNTNFPSPTPNEEDYNVAQAAFDASLVVINTAKAALAEAYAQRDLTRAVAEDVITKRGEFVQKTSGGIEPIILSSGLGVQDERTRTTHIDAPMNLHASPGDGDGECHLSWSPTDKAVSYVIQARLHPEDGPHGEWFIVAVGTRSRADISSLNSAAKYGFRVKAVGPNELESAYSNEAFCTVP